MSIGSDKEITKLITRAARECPVCHSQLIIKLVEAYDFPEEFSEYWTEMQTNNGTELGLIEDTAEAARNSNDKGEFDHNTGMKLLIDKERG